MDPQSQTPQAQPVQVLQQLTPPAKKAPSKMLLLILGCSVLAVGVSGYILGMRNNVSKQAQVTITPTVVQSTPTPDPMVDWKTYTSNKFKYTIKYPPTVTVEELKDDFPTVNNENKIVFTMPGGKLEITHNRLGTDFGPIKKQIINIAGIEEEKWYINQKSGLIANVESPAKDAIELYFSFSQPSTEQTIDQMLSTFKFTDAEEAATSSNDIKVRTILYKKTVGLADYNSNTGYSIQIPNGFQAGEPEKMNGSSCMKYFNNGAGGITTATIVPYNGGSRRALLPEEASYTYTYEDVILQGIKSLIQQKGPTGESGSGTNVIIPVGKYALIVGMANRGKDDAQFISLLQSIVVNNPLDISKCGQ